jgi:hypothetical protein
MAISTEKLVRTLIRSSAPLLTQKRAHALERWHRGREDFQKLRHCDLVVVSRGKSGRTWLRTMLSRFYSLAYGLAEGSFLDFDNLHLLNSRIPRVFFTHDNNLRVYTGARDSRRDFYYKKLLLMVRLPQDVAVSQFFQWKYRMQPRKMKMSGYPEHGSDISLFDFVMAPGSGLPRVIEFMNQWADELPKVQNHLLVRYEDLRANPTEGFGRAVAFFGEQVEPAWIEDAVEYSSVENMRAMEREGQLPESGGRLSPGDRDNPDSYKVRRAVVGGYRDYFDGEQIDQIDALVRTKLSPQYGYTSETGAAL